MSGERPFRPVAQRLPEEHPRTDAELLAALESDDGSALGTLYDRHAGLVYGVAVAILQSPQEAEDLTQEVFVTLSGDHAYDPGRGQLAGFLVAMTRSRAIDRLRSRGRHLRLLKRWHTTAPALALPATPPQQVSTKECAERVRAALTQLSDREREVLELSYWKGLTQAEIADQLGAPLGTVKSWARRGLLSLRDSLQDLVG